MFYFAYASNLNHQQMKRRCPDSKFLTSASLKGYKFVYQGYTKRWDGAVGNIIKSPGDGVWGGVYEISQKDLDSLDVCENYPKVYNRDSFKVKGKDGKTIEVITYFRKSDKVDSPSSSYRNTTVQGAKECNLPKQYIKKFLL